MAVKWNRFANRFLRSLLALAVTFLLLYFALCLTPYSFLADFAYIRVFGVFALLICACIFIPITAIKIILKILLCLVAFAYAPFYLDIPINIPYIISNLDIIIPKLILYLFVWLITICKACKEGKGTAQQYANIYVSRLNFFKKFSTFIGIIFNVAVIVLFFVDYTLILKCIIDLFSIMAFYLIVELLLIRVSRDAIYSGVQNLDKRKITLRGVLFSIFTAISAVCFYIFKEKLNLLLLKWIAAIRNFFVKITILYKNFISYFTRLLASIRIKQNMLNSDFFEPEKVPSDILDNFGMGNIDLDKIRPNLPGGDNVGGNGGGIGSIVGSLGDLGELGGGLGGLDGLGGLGGLISIPLSENGNLGVGNNSEAIQGNSAAMAFVRVERSTDLYLKLKSFGDYNGKGFDEAIPYTGLLSSTYSMNYLAGAALADYGYAPIGIEIVSLTGQYFLPDYPAMGAYLYDIQTNDVYASGDTSDVYRLAFYTYIDSYSQGSVPSKYWQAEQAYQNYVYQTYLQLPDSTRESVTTFLNANGIYENDWNVVDEVFNLLSHYTYYLEYDKTLDKQNDVVMSFLTTYKEGICQHFASSTVVMLRALNIPARYVGGLHAGVVSGGTWTAVTANAAHAWVEIYKPGFGWARLDPTSVAQYKEPPLDPSYEDDEYKEIVESHQSFIESWESGWEESDDPGYSFDPDDSDLDSNDIESGEHSITDSSDKPHSSKEEGESSDKTDSSKDETSSSEGEESSSEEILESSEKQSSDSPNCAKITWTSIGIGAGVLACTVIVVLLLKFKKKAKKAMKKPKIKKNLTEEEALLLEEEISRAAAMIIRENYKEFIKTAGKNGIRKYPADTTKSLRSKYKKEMGENEAIEILTKLYRIARYNKNEKLTVDDANQSTYCLEVIQKEFARKKKEKYFE